MLAGLFASTMTTAHLPSKATKSSSINKARALLRGVGVAREDSDDELGDEDLPWEWVYSAEPDTFDQVGHSEINGKKREIIGARTGDFDVRIGDCVFIKGDGLQGEAYVGMACEFEDSDQGTEDDMSVNVMWFSTEFEIKNKEKKRMDFLPNELYINPSYNLCPLRSINGRAKILSPKVFNEQYPNGVPKKSRDYGKVFVCRRGCNPRTANYTPELDWDTIYKGRDTDIFAIGELVRQGTKATRTKAQKHAATENRGNRVRPKRRRRETSVDSDDSGDRDFIREGTVETIPEEDEEAEDDFDVNNNNFSRKTKAPRTPSKRRTNFTFSTPTQKNLLTPTKNLLTTPTRRTPTSARKFTTPTNRKITIKKPLLFTPLNTRTLPNLSSPYAAARHHLHVSTLPASLPCREAEFNEVYTQLSAAITEGTGSCIYISGTPGTGKTATVREVITQLRHLVALEELDDFTFVEINGMKVADPHQSYSLLWEAIKGDRVSPSQALGLLESEFSTPSPRRVPCVVLMDELDQLVTKGQGVMYNFFNWPGGKYSRLIVLAVANTMDLPERTLSNKISSRLGLTRITFPGYTYDQLMTIIKSRLESVQGDIVDADAVQFASRKVAAVSGDARRALDICRRAVEMVEYAPFISSENEKGRRLSGKVAMMREDEDDGSGGGGIKAGGRVTIATIRQAILEATSSPVQVFLKTCSLSSKVFLVALLVRCRRSGVGESVLRDVMDEAARIVKIQEIGVEELGGEARVGGIESAVKGLVEAGVVGLEKKGSGGGRVRFLINEEEIKIALKDDKAIGAVVGRAG